MKASGQAVTDIHGSFFFYTAGFNQPRVKNRDIFTSEPVKKFNSKEASSRVRGQRDDSAYSSTSRTDVS